MYEGEHDDPAGEAFEEAQRSVGDEQARAYLGSYGDAISERVNGRLAEAKAFLEGGHKAAALVWAVTAIEITIRFMLLRPLLKAGFMTEDWEDILGERLASGSRTEDDRKLLPRVLGQWYVRPDTILVHKGQQLMHSVEASISKRNRIVHAGESCSQTDASIAIECAESLLTKIVHPLGARLWFDLGNGNKWSDYSWDLPGGDHKPYSPRDPF
jgi:hypothetical protein